MRKNVLRRLSGVFLIVAMGLLSMSGAAIAQQPVPAEHYTLDPRRVDLVSGTFNYATTEVVIGQPGAGGLSYGRVWLRSGWRDLSAGTINASGSTYTVSAGAESEIFTRSGSTFTPASNNGATLVLFLTGYKFTSRTGDAYYFDPALSAAQPYIANIAVLGRINKANGEIVQYHFFSREYCAAYDPYSSECIDYQVAIRLESITNNYGYQLKYYYLSDEADPNTLQQFYNQISVRGINNSIDYCDPGTPSPCTFTRTWPSVTYNNPYLATTATDESGRTTTYSFGVGGLTGVRFPGSINNDISITNNSTYQVTALTDVTGSWTYGYSTSGTTRTTTVAGPSNQSITVVSDLTKGRVTSLSRITSISPPASSTWGYLYDGQLRLTRVTNPEGDYTEATYDARGNVTQTTAAPKAGSGLANLTTSATFPAACANPVICNLPTSMTDERGNVTNYTWDSAHGGLLTMTAPAPSVGADRPQTRYTYAPQTAYFKNSSGSIVGSTAPVALPTAVSACASGTSCAGTADEVRTTVAYGATGVANNLLPTIISEGSGSTPAVAVTLITYTANGDVETVDGPLPGIGDITRYRYDNARQLTGIVGPDPDGGGPLVNRAQRLTYDPGGEVTLVESGTTPGYTDPDWANFATLQRQETVYDAYDRPVQVKEQSAGGATISLQQMSYDAAGRLECSAIRMNPATFGSLPSSACSLGTAGSFGADRIVQATFDPAGRTISTVSGVGTADAITEAVSYTANGEPATLTDGNGNVSSFVYDGFDRVSRLRYPNATCCGISTTDYDEYAYDAASNITSYRNRGGDNFALSYDALNRLTKNDGPAGTGDIEYAYDNLGRMTCASLVALPTCTNAFTYDTLSNQLTETGPLGAMTSEYDPASRRTRLMWPDAVYVTYAYDVYGAMTEIKENGATSLATYAYDNLGRRTGIARGNGVPTTYSYDSISRLSSIAQNPSGTGQDLSVGLGYNPSSQITERTVSNSAYVYAPVTGATAYANNGRNQVTNTGAAVTYDGRGNITGALGASYGYDARNALVSAGAATFQYDPLGRLSRSNGAADTRFQYDGVQAATEYDALGAVVRRYVPGPNLDETVVSYAGANTATKTWPVNDERGSVIALTDGSGAASINRYDEYGVPASGNTGRFQYTGQMWLEDASLYHYRARAYSAPLGRFLQSDPVGYDAGANVYAYVGADPINRFDPFGLGWRTITWDVCSVSSTLGRPDIWTCSTRSVTIWIDEGPAGGISSGGRGNGSVTGGTDGATKVDDVVVIGKRPVKKVQQHPCEQVYVQCRANIFGGNGGTFGQNDNAPIRPRRPGDPAQNCQQGRTLCYLIDQQHRADRWWHMGGLVFPDGSGLRWRLGHTEPEVRLAPPARPRQTPAPNRRR